MNTLPQTIKVYDPAMCCSSGVCGPDVVPKIVQFAADLEWLKREGMIVQRFNLSQDPGAFSENEVVITALQQAGEAALPMIVIGGRKAFSGQYPSRGELSTLLGISANQDAPSSSTCCEDSGCC